MNAIKIRGSTIDMRSDLHDSLELEEQGKVEAIVAPAKMENINDVFHRMHQGQSDGGIVLNMTN